jgi:uroporphyrinogen-III synthase
MSNNLGAVNDIDNLSKAPNAIYIGVGATTTKKLSTLGLQVIQASPPNSEGIVAVVKQLKLRSANVAKLKGSGGRKLISASLSALGLIVAEFDVYERLLLNKPFYTDSLNSKSFEPEKIQCIIATSTEIIDATYHFFDSTWLNSSHWIVVSERTKQHLVALGANNITVSNGATDSHLIAAVNHFKGPYHE